MAKAKKAQSTKKVKRHYPVQRNIQLKDEATPAIAGGRLLQGAQELSSVNRRLYRENRLYSMKLDVEPGTALAQAGVSVYVLRDTWDLHGAYKTAMKMYYNAMKEELQAGGANSRWHDFRVLPDFQGPTLRAVVSAPSPSAASMVDDETVRSTQMSLVTDQNGATRLFSMAAQITNATQFGVMKEWQNQDRVDNDPASSSLDLPYDELIAGRNEQNYDDLKTQGATPPYDVQASLHAWRRVGNIRETATGVSKLSTGYFDAPLGLVILISSAFTTDEQTWGLHVSFQNGDYKGVKAPAYATPMLVNEKEYEVV